MRFEHRGTDADSRILDRIWCTRSDTDARSDTDTGSDTDTRSDADTGDHTDTKSVRDANPES